MFFSYIYDKVLNFTSFLAVEGDYVKAKIFKGVPNIYKQTGKLKYKNKFNADELSLSSKFGRIIYERH